MRRLSIICGVLLALSLVLEAAPAMAYQPPPGARFNVPRPWGNDTQRFELVRTVEKAIRKTRPTKKDPKPFILISTFLMDRKKTTDALIGACKRGVSVRVIFDEDIASRPSRRLITTLNADNVKDRNGDGKPDHKPRRGPCNRKRHKVDAQGKVVRDKTGDPVMVQPRKLMSTKAALRSVKKPRSTPVTWGKDRSYVKKCSGSCRGAGGNMHSKFYVFSHSGKGKNVVIVSSSNLNMGGALLGWNDMYVMTGRPKSVAAYKRIHLDMTDDVRAPVKKVQVNDGPFTSRFFPMRKATKRNDPTMQDLNKVKCTSAIGRTQVHVSMFYWKGKRGNYIADKLLSLAHRGCAVNVIYGAPSRQIAARLRNAAAHHVINLYDSRWDLNDDGTADVRTHAKYVLVKGTVGSDRSSWQVWTGTQNWVAGSLSKGDENSLNIRLKSAYKKYFADWVRIRKHSRRLPYSQYPPPANGKQFVGMRAPTLYP